MNCKYKYIDKEAREFLFNGTISFDNKNKNKNKKIKNNNNNNNNTNNNHKNKNLFTLINPSWQNIMDTLICYMHENDMEKVYLLFNKYRYIGNFGKVLEHLKCLPCLDNYTIQNFELQHLEHSQHLQNSNKLIEMSMVTFIYNILTRKQEKNVSIEDLISLSKPISEMTYNFIRYPQSFRNIFKYKANGRFFTCYDAFQLISKDKEDKGEKDNKEKYKKDKYPMFFIDFAIDYFMEMDYENFFYVLISGLRSAEAVTYYRIYLASIDISEVKGFVVNRCSEVFFVYKLEKYDINPIPLSQFLKDYKDMQTECVVLKYKIPLSSSIQGYRKYL